MALISCSVAALLFASVLLAEETAVTPLTNVHAHNDYEHKHPLFDALDQGFCSVEADVHLVDGKLLVAHDRSQVKPERTLQALYLEPLRKRAQANQGRIFAGAREFYLLIDFKGDTDGTWKVLQPILEQYADILTVFREDITQTNAVTAVLTGEQPRAALTALPVRRAALDGKIADLAGTASSGLIPWISENWSSHFKWRGWQEMPNDENLLLREIVTRAHQQGRKVRFWGGPDSPALWRAQLEAGVDLINTDKLADLRKFLLTEHQPQGTDK